MGKQTRTTLKNYFSTGKVPTQGDYADFIDSFLNLEDTDPQNLKGTISSSQLDISTDITASGNIQVLGGYITSSQLYVENIYATNDITASANISSSGIIFAHNITSSGNLSVQGSSSFHGDITASGQVISCSALSVNAIKVHKIQGGSPIHIVDSMIVSSSITASADIKIGNIIFDKLNSRIKGAAFDAASKANITDLTKLNVSGYVTSSGVSSSATIYAPDAQFGNSTVFLDGVNGHITASGNISASGEIVGDYRRIIQTKTSAGALVIGDAGTYNRCGSHILTIPLNSSVAFTTGTEIEFIQTSSVGHLFVTGASGVTVNSRNTLYSSSGQFSAISCKKVDTNEWDMIGDLTS